MPHTIHLRLTPADLSGITVESIQAVVSGWSDKWAITSEHEDTNHHYHVAVENVKFSEKTCRNHITDTFNIPKVIRGQQSAYYALKYDAYQSWDVAYVVKDGSIQAYSGYTEDELEDAQIRGALRWPKKVKKSPVEAAAVTLVSAAAVSKKMSEFEKLKELWELRPNRDELNMAQIRRWIISTYLKQRRLIPRSNDIARMSYVLYAIEHDKTEEHHVDGLDADALLSGQHI